MKKILYQLLGMLAVLLSRFGFLLPNFSMVGSYGFFGRNFIYFLGSIVIFDLIKGGFYPGWWFTYLGFFGYYILGYLSRKSYLSQALCLPIASFTFFLISNFGVWWLFFPHTMVGLAGAYIPAIPFYQNTLIGDLVFGYGFLAIKYLVSHSEKLHFLAIEPAT